MPASLNFKAPMPDKLPECKDPIDGSATTTATTGDNGEVCIKVVVSGKTSLISNYRIRIYFLMFSKYSVFFLHTGTVKVGTTETDVEAIVRHKFPISGKCGAIENLISDAGDLADLDLSADCYECDEDKCNSATSIQISFLSFLALFVSLYFIRR